MGTASSFTGVPHRHNGAGVNSAVARGTQRPRLTGRSGPARTGRFYAAVPGVPPGFNVRHDRIRCHAVESSLGQGVSRRFLPPSGPNRVRRLARELPVMNCCVSLVEEPVHEGGPLPAARR